MLGNLQVGFKWIAMTIDEDGPERFVFGCEESHGYLVGDSCARQGCRGGRDAAGRIGRRRSSTAAKRCITKLDALYWQFGYHAERQISLTMPGSQGMKDMQALMARFRNDPPRELAGTPIVAVVRDYQSLTSRAPGDGASLSPRRAATW